MYFSFPYKALCAGNHILWQPSTMKAKHERPTQERLNELQKHDLLSTRSKCSWNLSKSIVLKAKICEKEKNLIIIVPFIHNRIKADLDYRKYCLFIFMIITPLIDCFYYRYSFAFTNSFQSYNSPHFICSPGCPRS